MDLPEQGVMLSRSRPMIIARSNNQQDLMLQPHSRSRFASGFTPKEAMLRAVIVPSVPSAWDCRTCIVVPMGVQTTAGTEFSDPISTDNEAIQSVYSQSATVMYPSLAFEGAQHDFDAAHIFAGCTRRESGS